MIEKLKEACYTLANRFNLKGLLKVIEGSTM